MRLIRKPLSQITKYCLSYIPLDFLNKLLNFAILRQEFSDLNNSYLLSKKEDMWDFLIEKIGENEKIIYIEFGVFEGYSIKYFSSKNKNKDSIFLGLDSFKGLPEKWNKDILKGHFSLEGKIPIFKDSRVSIIDGYFQDTRSNLIKRIESVKDISDYKLVVHYDADLYSSTLFALTLIDSFNKNYIAIFDEIYDQESKALFDYIKSFSPTIKFLARVSNDNCKAAQCACEIEVKVN